MVKSSLEYWSNLMNHNYVFEPLFLFFSSLYSFITYIIRE